MVYFPIVHDGLVTSQGQSSSEMSLLGHRDCADSLLGADRGGSAAVGLGVRRLSGVKPWQPPTSAPTPHAVDDAADETIADETATAETVDQVPVAEVAGEILEEAVAEEVIKEDSGLPSMADLDRLSVELDEIDATLARMDAGKAVNEQSSAPAAPASGPTGTAPSQPTFGGNQFRAS